MLYGAARMVGGVTYGDESYGNIMTNGDRSWSISRGFAVLGALCGFVACVLIGVKICCSKFNPKKEFVLYGTILAFLCEGVKFGVFFNVNLCTSSDMWLQTGGTDDESAVGEAGNTTDMKATSNMTYVDLEGNTTSDLWVDNATAIVDRTVDAQYSIAQECDLSRGSLASMGSMVLYLVAMVLVFGNVARPSDPSHDSNYGGYDDVSLPTYLKSIGQSVASKKTKSTKQSAPTSVRPKDHTDISTIGMSMM